MSKAPKSTVPSRPIEHHIHIIRGQKVMLDSELAALYGVSTGALNQAVRRNLDRFPEDFMFTAARPKWVMSLAARRKIAKAQRARWAKVKAKKAA